MQSRWAGRTWRPGDAVFGQLEDADDEGEPLGLHAAPGRTESTPGTATEVLVGSEMLPATRRERGASTLVWLDTGGVTVVIAAHGLPLDRVALQSISDLTPVKEERLRVVRRFLAERPFPPPPYDR